MTTIGELKGVKGSMDVHWIIQDFLKLLDVKDTKYLSPPFDFAGASWYLMIYPNGFTTKNTVGQFHSYLMKSVPEHSVSLSFEMGFRKRDGNIDKDCSATRTFDSKNPGLGCSLSTTSNLLAKKSDLFPSNIATIICRLTQEKPNIGSSLPFRRIKKLSSDLRDLAFNGKDGDVTVRIQEKEFKLHKNILRIRSPAFATIVIKELEESSLDAVDIYDCNEAVFKMFIEYVYTGEVNDFSQQNICQLYQIAEKYTVVELKEDCLEYIKDTLSTDTFFDSMKIAEKYDEKDLSSLISNFCSNNLRDLVKSPNWLIFMKENTKKAYELLSTALDSYVKS